MLGLMNGICSHRKKLTHRYPSAADENRFSSRIEASAGRWVDYLPARGDIDPSRMTVGQHDYIAAENAIDVHESCKRSGVPLALKVFSTEDSAESGCHINNPTLAKEFVFDWLRRKLGSPERIAASAEDACDCAGA